MVVDNLTAAHLTPILEENIAKEARVMTDEAPVSTSVLRTPSKAATASRATAQGEYRST